MALINRVRRVYTASTILAVTLFAFHSFVLVETGHLLLKYDLPLIHFLGMHISDTLLLLTAFAILYVTHFLESVAWALLFLRIGEFKSLDDAIYFTGTSLTALGYGDITLKGPWRRLGPVMATNGILLYGCSTAFLFMVIHKVWLNAGS